MTHCSNPVARLRGPPRKTLRLVSRRRQVELSVFITGWVLALASIAPVLKAEGFAFTAQGTVSTECYHADQTNAFLRQAGRFVFAYGGESWEIEFQNEDAFYPGMENDIGLKGVISNCKRIPDGIRLFTTFSNRLAVAADSGPSVLIPVTAEPATFPPAEQRTLFLPWLTFCPKAQLPMLDGTHIRRLIGADLLSNSKNVGDYKLEYLEPGRLFIALLDITNNGVMFLQGGRTMRLPPPLEQGHLEFGYRVLETTNFAGIRMPARSILYTFQPARAARSAADLRLSTVTRLELESVQSGRRRLEIPPRRMYAMDARPPELRNGVTVNYIITNDQWSPLTNSHMKPVVQSLAHRQPPRSPDRVRRTIVLSVLVAIVIAPVLWLAAKKLKRRTD
jgi:hypothetical protein